MKQPSEQQRHAIEGCVRNYPHLLTWLEEAYNHELRTLPSVMSNTALAQGRCLVLGELIKQFTEALKAKPQGS